MNDVELELLIDLVKWVCGKQAAYWDDEARDTLEIDVLPKLELERQQIKLKDQS